VMAASAEQTLGYIESLGESRSSPVREVGEYAVFVGYRYVGEGLGMDAGRIEGREDKTIVTQEAHLDLGSRIPAILLLRAGASSIMTEIQGRCDCGHREGTMRHRVIWTFTYPPPGMRR